DRRHQVDDRSRECDLRGARQHRIGGKTSHEPDDVRQRPQQRLHPKLSATSSLTSLTASRSSAPTTLRPRSTIARQNGHAVATVLAPVASSSSVRMTLTRFSDLISIHMWPPPPPQQRPRSRALGGSTTRRPGTAAATRRGASMIWL